ncbi:hypothetical protein A6M14_11650 [Acinetobacter sp. Ac_877]|uniref:hypothetical protein n=1 Tax=Acinetobacter portensis TaxID=1839785 RepID=UPI00128D7BB0|nr:hypothetical protein [Acinetobacter portensis]MPW42240.1 hypothetical protein [Acinetobacter portensis]
MFKKSILISSLFLISACSTEIKTIHIPRNIVATKTPGKILIPKYKNTVRVGEEILTAGEYRKEATTIKYEAFNIYEQHEILAKHRRKIVTYHLKPADFFLYHTNEEGSYYKARESVETSERSAKAYIGLFVPKNKAEATDMFWNWNTINDPNFYQIKLLEPIKGIKSTKFQFLNDRYGSITPSATITYAGVSNGQIRFVYNEFTNNGYIRPSFKQEVSLDYKPNRTYAFKNALFKVHKADSININFEIIRPLD